MQGLSLGLTVIPLPNQVRIFPLSEVVLFPDTLLPLHIFEPRYRDMLCDAIRGDGVIGMTLCRQGVAQPEPVPVYPVGCAGKVDQHKELEDGRSLIVLRGTVRFRIAAELESDHAYRVVNAQALYEAPATPEESRTWRPVLQDSVERLVAAMGGDSSVTDDLFEKLEPTSMVNYLCASLPLSPIEKQGLLECATMAARYARLKEFVDFKIVEAGLGLRRERDQDS